MGANQSNVPIEMIEAEYPIRIERYGWCRTPAAPVATAAGYRCRDPIVSVRRGRAQRPLRQARNSRHMACSAARRLPICMTDSERVFSGDLYWHIMAGGGGVGDPLDREVDRVFHDVLEDRVSLAHARNVYGVIVEKSWPLPLLDRPATEALRKSMREERRATS
jgi:N-methylhydantoinase B